MISSWQLKNFLIGENLRATSVPKSSAGGNKAKASGDDTKKVAADAAAAQESKVSKVRNIGIKTMVSKRYGPNNLLRLIFKETKGRVILTKACLRSYIISILVFRRFEPREVVAVKKFILKCTLNLKSKPVVLYFELFWPSFEIGKRRIYLFTPNK